MKLDDKTREEAAAWFSALRRGPMSIEEREAFDGWRADPFNQAALNHMHELWGEVSAIKELGVTAPQPVSRARRIAGASSALALLVAFGVGGSWWLAQPDQVRTDVGEQRTATLEDGSVVGLNVVTRVAYDMKPTTREVTLKEGEAIFFVKKDAARPFLVTAGDYEIRAVGTAFNVRRRGDEVDVAVAEGVVSVKALTGPRAGQEIARLPAGQQLKLGPAAQDVQPVPVEGVAQWRMRVLDYEDATVAEVVEDLNRFFERPVTIENPALAGRRVTLRLQVEDRDRTLQNLGKMLGAQIEPQRRADLLIPAA
jgi:transmembrane sensor